MVSWDKVATVGVVLSRGCSEFKQATFRQAITGVSDVEANRVGVAVSPNLNKVFFIIRASDMGNNSVVVIAIMDVISQVVYSAEFMPDNGVIRQSVVLGGNALQGVCLVNIAVDGKDEVKKFVIRELKLS